MIEACPTCLGYVFFFKYIFFRNPGYCRILHRDFWLMQMDLCLDLKLGMGNYLRIFGSNEKKISPTGIRLQLRPCHPGQHGHYTMLQIWKHTETCKFEYHRH